MEVVHNGGGNFELTLDQRKLKTPLGAIFKVQNETLAKAVAHEWMAQKDVVLLSQMHLTGKKIQDKSSLPTPTSSFYDQVCVTSALTIRPKPPKKCWWTVY